MLKNKYGRIVNISSVSSGGTGVGVIGASHYTASKAGVLGVTEALANEWAKFGINVNAIMPTSIETKMITDSPDVSRVIESRIKRIPIGRMGKPKEVASAVVFLASEEASYITGAVLAVDGGFLSA